MTNCVLGHVHNQAASERLRDTRPLHRFVSAAAVYRYESVYLYLSLSPFTGQGYAAFLPKLNANWFQWIVQQVDKCLTTKSLFIMNGARAHKADSKKVSHLVFQKLPPYCPELNPAERLLKRSVVD